MSWCSGCIVTGRTTSAKSVVSVRRCSSTTVKRSSRARPRRTRTWFGLLAAGFALKTTIAAIGGSSISVSASPSRDMLTVRAGGAGRSGGDDDARDREREVVARHATARRRRRAASRPSPPGWRGRHGWRRRRRRGAACRARAGSPSVACGPAARPSARTTLDVEPADLRRPLDRPLGEPRLELRPADRVALEPVAVGCALVEHRSHEPERERGVGPRQRRDVLVAAGGRLGADRIDGDEVGPASTGLEHELPHVQVRVEGVRPPEDHELRVDRRPRGRSRQRRRASRRTRHGPRRSRGSCRSCEAPEVAEQPRPERPALDVPHRARVVVREDRLGPVALDGVAGGPSAVSRSASSQRDLLETTLALAPDAAQRDAAAGPASRRRRGSG